MPVLHDILLEPIHNLIIPAVPVVFQGSLSAANPAPVSSSWLSLAGAIGAVIGALIAGTIGFASSWYALRRQGLQAFNERFATAAEKLGDPEAATRLAGVYAMAGLADDWKEQRQTCIDVLCGYMRLPYQPTRAQHPSRLLPRTLRRRLTARIGLPPKRTPGQPEYKVGEREVRLAILRTVRDHLRKDAKTSWQGCIFRFHRAVFDGGNLSHIVMSKGYMSFYHAKFVGHTLDLRHAIFMGGTTDFQEAQFLEGMVDLRHAEFLTGSTVKFPDCELIDGKVDVRHAKFSGGAVDFSTVVFSGSGTLDIQDPETYTGPPKLPQPLPAGILQT
jgi:hypothetical protein